MIGWRVFFISTILLCGISFAYAQTASCKDFNKTQFGYVNIRKLMQNAPQIDQISQKLSGEFDAQRKNIIALRSKVAELINAYDEVVAIESEKKQDDLARLQKEIDDKQAELMKTQQRMQSDYNRRRNEEIAQLQTLIVNMVAKVAKERKLVNVQNETAVIYVNSCVDITPKVFEYLSEQIID